MAIFLKDPAAVIDYAVDWAAAYLAGAEIAESDWQVAPAGLLVMAASHDAGRSTVTLAGGARGCAYRLTNRVTFSDGRRDERSLDVRVEER